MILSNQYFTDSSSLSADCPSYCRFGLDVFCKQIVCKILKPNFFRSHWHVALLTKLFVLPLLEEEMHLVLSEIHNNLWNTFQFHLICLNINRVNTLCIPWRCITLVTTPSKTFSSDRGMLRNFSRGSTRVRAIGKGITYVGLIKLACPI